MTEPTRWLVDHAHLLPEGGRALDVASGGGRNTLWLAGRGFITHAIDRDPAAVRQIREAAARLELPVCAEVIDLEAGQAQLPVAAYDVIVVVHYLYRPLFPALLAAMRPGGVMVYETFLREQAWRGRPRNPSFLLERGELRRLVAPCELLDEREGEFEEMMLASVIARCR